MPRLPDVERIAVLRANGLGDLVFALPALEALRAAYPDAHLALLAAPWHLELLSGRPGPYDELIEVPLARGVREEPGRSEDPGALADFFAAMRRRRFDLAVQLHGGGRNSNPFLLQLGARLSAGLRTPDAASLDFWVPYVYYQNEVLRMLEVVSLLGAEPRGLEPRLAVTDDDRKVAAELLGGPERPLAALHPGAGDPRRRWPPACFAAVGDALAEAGAEVVVTGSAAEAPLAAEVVGRMRAPARDLSGRLSLGGLLGVLERCAVTVSNDSGPLHLAAAVGCATVGIYWCGNLINAGPAFRSRHRPAISWRLRCPVCDVDCTRSSCPHDASFVADVAEAEVRAAALELLAAGAR